MKAKQAAEFTGKREDANLDRRYGKIAIPALAAALAFQGETRNDTAPQTARAERWLAEREAA